MKIYLLLNNNKIIDASKYTYRQEKKPDNLVDLIEVGDLIEYKLTGTTSPIYYAKITSITIDNNGKTIHILNNSNCEMFTILKLFKPNENKGFDLAWERDE